MCRPLLVILFCIVYDFMYAYFYVFGGFGDCGFVCVCYFVMVVGVVVWPPGLCVFLLYVVVYRAIWAWCGGWGVVFVLTCVACVVVVFVCFGGVM